MKIAQSSRVIAAPVHAMFPYPERPEFTFTIFPAEAGPINLADAGGFETSVLGGCVHARPLFVPINNEVTGETIPAGTWYNANFKTLTWVKSGTLGHLVYQNEVFETPWVRSTWTREQALAVFYSHQTSPPGSPGTRNDYDPANSAITLTADTFDSEPLRCQGLFMRLGMVLDSVSEAWAGAPGSWAQNLSFPAESTARPKCDLTLKVDTENGLAPYWYRITYRQSGNPELSKSSDGLSFVKLMDINVPSSLNQVAGSPSHGFYGYYGWSEDGDGTGQMIDVRLIAGFLEIRFGGHARPIQVPHFLRDEEEPVRGEPAIFITEIQVSAEGAREIYLGASPMMFEAECEFETADQALGFVPMSEPVARVRYAFTDKESDFQNAVPGSSVSTEVEYNDGGPSTSARVRCTMASNVKGTYNGKEYSDRTSLVRAITVTFPEVGINPWGAATQLYPEEIVVEEDFNPETLELSRSAKLTFNNFNPISATMDGPDIYWGELANYKGAIGILIDSRLDYYDDNDNWLGGTDWQRLFTGYGDLKSTITITSGGKSKYVMECFDRSIAMRNPQFWLPWMDGWNLYYAAAFMANIGGVKKGVVGDTDMAFRQYVPDDPFGDAGDPSGTAYFLPMGSGGSPLMKAAPGAAPWDILQRFGRQAGFMRYFDRHGKFHFEKYRLASSAVPYRVFHLYDNEPEGINGVYASAVFSGVVQRDLTQVKNHVTIIGIDAFGPLWNPIVAHRSDTSSIYASATHALQATSSNYLGFRSNLVWMDSQFANLDYASDAADEVFNVVRSPNINSGLHTWHQPDLELGQRIGVRDIKSGLYDRGASAYLELMVVNLKHHLRLGAAPSTHIGVRFIPPGTGEVGPF